MKYTMKMTNKLAALAAIALLAFAVVAVTGCNQSGQKQSDTQTGQTSQTNQTNKAIQYTCAMHPEVVQDMPGKCPKCGMELIEKH